MDRILNDIASDQIYHAAAFEFFAALLSGTGQTYFIGLFGDQLRVSLELTEFGLGVLFGTATLVSGLLMFWLGAMAGSTAVKKWNYCRPSMSRHRQLRNCGSC